MRSLRIGLGQINSTLGDFEGNTRKMLTLIDDARSLGVDLMVFPELAISGYPPEDLLLKPQFVAENLKYFNEIVDYCQGITVVVGFIDGKGDIYNAAAVIHDRKLAGTYHKVCLPNYGVFDEKRYFKAGTECPVYVVNGVGIGVNICEDIWYEAEPVIAQAHSGAEVIVNISASPYHAGKRNMREKMLSSHAAETASIVVFTNMVGGQDELVFDGNSMVFDEKGELIAQGKQFEEDLVVLDLDLDSVSLTRLNDPRRRKEALSKQSSKLPSPTILVSKTAIGGVKKSLPRRVIPSHNLHAEIYGALVLGTRDYVRKNGFDKVLIGLSGGLDSSLVAAVAVDALGVEDVVGVSMPTRYSSEGSESDARLLADNLGIKLMTIPVDEVFQSYLTLLAKSFEGREPDVTEENLQARVRGNVLMALSNKFGWLVLTTGNKSEYATGYATLYGDMAGGFAVIKDVPKTLAYELARYRNSVEGHELIPSSIITKEPSAELRHNQRDADTLPAYDILDPILTAYVEEDKSVGQVIAMGYDEAVVQKAAKLVDISEYKRRQAPPGVKITPRAFGRDRRLPMTNRFREW